MDPLESSDKLLGLITPMKFLTSLILLVACVTGHAATITNWGAQLPNADPNGGDVILMQQGGVTRYFTPNQLATNLATNTVILAVISSGSATNKVADLNGRATNLTAHTALNLAGPIVPTGSNTVDVGSFLFPMQTNWVNDFVAKENGVILGRVGVGTNAPQEALDVHGKIAVRGMPMVYVPNQTYYVGTLYIGDPGALLTNSVPFEVAATDASFVLAVGIRAGSSNTIGQENTFVGANAGWHNTAGNGLAFLGSGAGQENTTASGNTFIGADCGLISTIGSNNVFIGNGTASHATNSSRNVYVGFQAGTYAIDANDNTSLGYQAGTFNKSSGSTFVGAYCGLNNTNGQYNTAVGFQALLNNLSGSNNTVSGMQSMQLNTVGSRNVANGMGALYSNTNGSFNVGIGYTALNGNLSGNHNTGVGTEALLFNADGLYNTSIGSQSLYNNTNGTANTGLGFMALWGNKSGTFNTALGYQAGYNSGVSLLALNNSTFIGNGATASADGLDNVTAIGNGATASASHQVVLGGPNVTTTLLKGNVGIGTTVPSSSLDVTGQVRSASAIFTNSVTIVGTTNQLIFGNTNPPPASAASPTKWVSVQITGDATLYRLPLYQ